jgi:Aegerolysin
VQSLSGEVLQRKDLHLAHGIWANANNEVPPEQIRAGKTAIFAAESDGAGTGCEGATTSVSDSGEWHINFDNPYFGSNQFSVTRRRASRPGSATSPAKMRLSRSS